MAGFLKLVLADDEDDFRVTRSGGVDLRRSFPRKELSAFPLIPCRPYRLRIVAEEKHTCNSSTLEFSLLESPWCRGLPWPFALAIETRQVFMRIKEKGSAGLLPADVKEVRFWIDDHYEPRIDYNDVSLQVRLFPCTGEAPFVQKIPLLLVID